MVRINWTLGAVEDLRNIKNYISKDSGQYAKIQVKRIKSRTEILKHQPFIGRSVPEVASEKIRELLEGNYRIIYKIVHDEQIDILTIHHSARNLQSNKLNV